MRGGAWARANQRRRQLATPAVTPAGCSCSRGVSTAYRIAAVDRIKSIASLDWLADPYPTSSAWCLQVALDMSLTCACVVHGRAGRWIPRQSPQLATLRARERASGSLSGTLGQFRCSVDTRKKEKEKENGDADGLISRPISRSELEARVSGKSVDAATAAAQVRLAMRDEWMRRALENLFAREEEATVARRTPHARPKSGSDEVWFLF